VASHSQAFSWFKFQFQPGVEFDGREHTGPSANTGDHQATCYLSRGLSVSGHHRNLQFRGSSSLASSLSGLNINGTSVSSLLSQYLGSNSVSVPQFQFEDLGITLKLTPQILRNDAVSLALDMKVEALAGSSIDNIPILNNRALEINDHYPSRPYCDAGDVVSSSEMKALTGLPGLSELPGFQGTDQDRQKSSTELLITITPHVVRSGRMEVSSRRIDTGRGRSGRSGGWNSCVAKGMRAGYTYAWQGGSSSVVECFLAKEDVAGSTPVSRSNNLNLNRLRLRKFRLHTTVRCVWPRGVWLWGFFCLRRGTQVVRERSAKPLCVGSIPTRASIHFPNK
jgi:hypothetical protein